MPRGNPGPFNTGCFGYTGFRMFFAGVPGVDGRPGVPGRKGQPGMEGQPGKEGPIGINHS